jgi:hypothetical protein
MTERLFYTMIAQAETSGRKEGLQGVKEGNGRKNEVDKDEIRLRS